MKKVVILLSMLCLINTLNSCDDKKEDEKEKTAQLLLAEAHILFAEKEYDKALKMIDSIYKVTPITLHEIRSAEYLGDSIIEVINKNKIDFLNEIVKQYKFEINKENNIKDKNKWLEKIDSIESVKKLSQLIIDNLYDQEVDNFEFFQNEDFERLR